MKIRITRIVQDLSSNDLEIHTKVDRSAIIKYERSKLNHKTQRGHRLCELIGIDPNWALEIATEQ